MRGLCIIALAGLAFGQAPIQVTTRLVQVAVVVRDKHGAVADLTKSDFEIFDKGKPRTIASFAVARASDHIARTPLPPNTFSNRLDQQADSPVAATVLLFDSLNTAFRDQAIVRNQMLKLLRSLHPETPVAIYALGNNLRILHDFTEDHTSLEQALRRYQNSYSSLLEGPQANVESSPATLGVPYGDDLVGRILEPVQTFNTDRRVETTLSAMQAIANRMAGVPGRKNLIWISGAFPLDTAFDPSRLTGGGLISASYAGPMKRAAMAIDRANVAVYPVDARGLMTSVDSRTRAGTASAASGLPTRAGISPPGNQSGRRQAFNAPPPELTAGAGEISAMQALAEWTGGRAFFNTNDIQGAVMQAMQDAEVTYTIGFYPEEKDLDGTYRELKVKVVRKGTDAHYRKGYFASAAVADAGQPAEILKNAVTAPADSTGLGLRALLTPEPGIVGAAVLNLVIDCQNLGLELRTGRSTEDMNFVVIQQTADGSVVNSIGKTFHFDVTDENRAAMVKNGIARKFRIESAPGVSQIRIAAMDQATGNVGSLRVIPAARP